MADRKRVGHVTDICYHRNGSGGNGFWTILFEGHEDSLDIAGKSFVATVFLDDEEEHEINTAVLALNPLVRGAANFCMRGDAFHGELKALCENHDWDEHKKRPHPKKPNRRAAIEHTKAKG